MDPSIVKLLEDDEDETMHSGADVEAFQAALNRDIGGDMSTSQPSGSDTVLSQGNSTTYSQSLPQWPASSHDNKTDPQTQQDPNIAQQQQQSSSEMEIKHSGQLQNVAPQDVNHPPPSQKQSQDEGHQGQTVHGSLQNPQTSGIPNPGKDPVIKNEPVKTHNQSNESQYIKLQQMSNQQATVTDQPSGQINRSKQVPFGLLLPILLPQLPKDRAMQLQTLFAKLKKDEIPKDNFVRLMKSIVGDQMLRMALAKVQSQTRSNQGPIGQQHPMRMPAVSSGATQFSDPHALAQLHHRSVNPPSNQSHINSSTVHVKNEPVYPTMDNSVKKSQELDVKIESQAVQPSQISSSSSNFASQESERSSLHIQGLTKQQQQHLHFSSAHGSSGTNYNLYSGTSSSSTSLKAPLHDSHLRQIPHQNIAQNHLGGPTQGMNLIGMTKLDRQNSINDPKRLQGVSAPPFVSSAGSQQTPNAWQPSNVKKEPTDLSAEQQQRHHLSKLHGISSVGTGQIEQGNGNQGTSKDEFSRGLPACTNMPPTTTSSLLHSNSGTPSMIAQQEPSPLSSQISTNPSGIIARAPLKKPSLGQKKPLEGLGSSPPPPSKKQKASGASMEQSIEQLNDVTAVSGVDLREEEEQLFSGPKEDSRISEASRRVVQEEEERLILQKAPLQNKLMDIMVKCGLKGMSNDVEKCLSLCVEERMRGLISSLIRLSKQRVDFEKTRHRVVVTSDVRQQIMAINKRAREEWEKKQTEAEKTRKLNEAESNPGLDCDKDKDEGRNKSTKVNKEEDDKMRTNAANVAARAAVGGDDMLSKWQLMAEQARQKREGVVDASSSSQPAKDASRKSASSSGRSTKDNSDGEKRLSTSFGTSGTARKLGRNQGIAHQTRVARSISVKDVIAALEREPQMSKSPLIYSLYERIHSDALAE
ncbi:transcription initiation factor TFIID subunit 4b-like [Prosopis cineraria]|uniref:transcription initiation factor TFIID subunit 4b-like n=1 Tax=Prosopis cineraria TaxID=364024 RepID=UPI00240EACD5|nr:transcription initiation factor TFIID subunit 4b-like [Prosopis cineraria]